MGTKMVDYAICIKGDLIEPMLNRIMNILRLEPPDSQYIHHTAFEPLRFWPIAVSIESKIASGNEAEATTQLSLCGVGTFQAATRNYQASRCYFGNASASLDQHSRRRMGRYAGGSEGRQDGAIKYFLTFVLG